MQEDGAITAAEAAEAGDCRRCRRIVAYERPRRDTGFHFVDQVAREAKTLAGIECADRRIPTRCARPSTCQLQRAAEAALQEGLCALRAQRRPRCSSAAAEANLGEGDRSAIEPSRAQAPGDKRAGRGSGAGRARGCRSTTCIGQRRSLVEKPPARRARADRVGLADGRILPLSVARRRIAAHALKLYDVVYVKRHRGQQEGSKAAAPAPSCACGRPCRAPRWCWRTRPGASWPWPAASPIR